MKYQYMMVAIWVTCMALVVVQAFLGDPAIWVVLTCLTVAGILLDVFRDKFKDILGLK